MKRYLIAATMVMALVFSAHAAVDPVTIEVHYQNGVKYFKRGLYDKSIQEFEKTLSLDPAHAEAKAYLDKVREFDKQQKSVEPKVSQDAELRQLYEQGRDLYRKGDYESAKEIFNKILEIKRVDDFASYHREQCEIYIARKLARERKTADKAKAKEKAQQEKLYKKEASAQKSVDRREMLAKRAVIKEEQRQAAEENVVQGRPALDEVKTAAETEKDLTPAQKKKREKQELAEEKRLAGEEKREAKIKERDEKILAKAERQARARQEKAATREAKVIEKDQSVARKNEKKQTAQETREERQRHKELFIKGVEQYGRKEYVGAVATFDELMERERKSGLVYTSTARRLKAKAELRLKGVGEDREL